MTEVNMEADILECRRRLHILRKACRYAVGVRISQVSPLADPDERTQAQ